MSLPGRICSRNAAMSIGGWLRMGSVVTHSAAAHRASLVQGGRFKSIKAPQPVLAYSDAFQADDADLEVQEYDYMREIGKVMVYCQAFSLPGDAPPKAGDDVSPDGAQGKRGGDVFEVEPSRSNRVSASNGARDLVHGDGEVGGARVNGTPTSDEVQGVDDDGGGVGGAGLNENGMSASDGAQGMDCDGEDDGARADGTPALPDSPSRSSDSASHIGEQAGAAGNASGGGAPDKGGDVVAEHRGDEGGGGVVEAGGERETQVALVGDQFDDSLVIINPKAKFGKSANIKRPNPFHGELPKEMEELIPQSKKSWIERREDVTDEQIFSEIARMDNAEAIIRHPEWGTQPFMDQFYYETRAVAIAAARYYQLLGNTFNRGAGSGSIVIQRFMMRSHVDLAKHIEKMQIAYMKKYGGKHLFGDSLPGENEAVDEIELKGKDGSKMWGPILISMPADQLAVITMSQMFAVLMRNPHGSKFLDVCLAVGSAVEAEYNLAKVKHDSREQVPYKYLQELAKKSDLKEIRKTFKKHLGKAGTWETSLMVHVGAALARSAISTIQVRDYMGNGVPAIMYANVVETHKFGKQKRQGLVMATQDLLSNLGEAHEVQCALDTKLLPMVVRPMPWTAANCGGYFTQQGFVMRTHGNRYQWHLCVLNETKMQRVFDALNVLGWTEWKINRKMLAVVQEAWRRRLAIGSLPIQSDEVVPTVAEFTSGRWATVEEMQKDYNKSEEEKKLASRYYTVAVKAKGHNADSHSLRSDIMNKLHVAVEMAKHPRFYLVHDLDFRGRAYPVPPHLNQMGSDFSRGLLSFARGKPLGEGGLRWLLIHLANLFGENKMPFNGREAWARGNMAKISQAAKEPLSAAAMEFYLKADDPWQALATCMEITAAVESGCPEGFVSHLHVQMDGSCNGLQHYAALGLDVSGGTQVNLVPGEKPGDPYTTVMKRVREIIDRDAEMPVGSGEEDGEMAKHKSLAKLLQGDKITRKIVKQTVMTTVYGVTLIGAKDQVANRLKETYGETGNKTMTEEEVNDCSLYIAKKTLEAVGGIFPGARTMMDWLKEVAHLVSNKQKKAVSWTTPLGLKAVQPYVNTSTSEVKTVVQKVTLQVAKEGAPVDTRKQETAFPPNFVHSLDSTHMLMTATAFTKDGDKTFSAVHDSFWTHACDIDELAMVLREQFVELYKQPILERLVEEIETEIPELKGKLPPIPQRGDLDLDVVKKSLYFFS